MFNRHGPLLTMPVTPEPGTPEGDALIDGYMDSIRGILDEQGFMDKREPGQLDPNTSIITLDGQPAIRVEAHEGDAGDIYMDRVTIPLEGDGEPIFETSFLNASGRVPWQKGRKDLIVRPVYDLLKARHQPEEIPKWKQQQRRFSNAAHRIIRRIEGY